MREVQVIGVGMSQFGKFPHRSFKDLGAEAVWRALTDAGVSPKNVQTAYCGNAISGVTTGQSCSLGQHILNQVGIMELPVVNVENACASAATAFREAWIAVGSGLYDVALAIGVETMTAGGSTAKLTEAIAGASDYETQGKMGFTGPAYWALRARKHTEAFGTTVEDLATVSVVNHRHGVLNPYAQYRRAVTLEEVLASRLICDPLTLLQCSPIGDGAAVAVLASREVAARLGARGVAVKASVLCSGNYAAPTDLALGTIEQRAAGRAYEAAGLGPEDVDIAEVHDCFSIAELIRLEALGFARPGEAAGNLRAGRYDLDGGRPAVNPSGGLLTKGHPIGATGIAQIAEVVWHLRGEAGDRQVPGARIGLAQNTGGMLGDEVTACAIHVLERA